MKYHPTIGLEIHIELKTKTKMFCRCLNDPFGREPNSNVCPVCLGLPGALPYPSQQAVLSTVLLGRALECQIAEFSKWDRKNYFYPDLPKGFQISQYDLPLCSDGYLSIADVDSKVNEIKSKINPLAGGQESETQSKNRKVRIRRIHLEEDTGKLLHVVGSSLIDYNRSGVPLLELVTEPDISSAKEARLFAKEIQLIVRHLGIAEADMEKGEMRVEANVSIKRQKLVTNRVRNERSVSGAESEARKVKSQKLGTKVEIKNLNSFRSVERAIEYELKRQKKLLEDGQAVIQETRGWDEAKGASYSQRIKESESDYRYFPEPDIPPIKLSQIAALGGLSAIETLKQKRQRYLSEFSLPLAQVDIILADQKRLSAFESVASVIVKQSSVDQTMIKKELQSVAKLLVNRPAVAKMPTKDIVALAQLTAHQQKLILDGGKNIADLKPTGQSEELGVLINKVLKYNSQAVDDYRLGKPAALGFLIGQVMKEARGSFEPDLIKNQLLKMIKEP